MEREDFSPSTARCGYWWASEIALFCWLQMLQSRREVLAKFRFLVFTRMEQSFVSTAIFFLQLRILLLISYSILTHIPLLTDFKLNSTVSGRFKTLLKQNRCISKHSTPNWAHDQNWIQHYWNKGCVSVKIEHVAASGERRCVALWLTAHKNLSGALLPLMQLLGRI